MYACIEAKWTYIIGKVLVFSKPKHLDAAMVGLGVLCFIYREENEIMMLKATELFMMSFN